MSKRDSIAAIGTAPIGTVPRSVWRRIVRIVGRVLGGLVLLVLLAVGFLHTPWGKSFVRSRVEHALAKKVNGTVHVGSLDYGFMFGSLTLGDLEIRDANGKPAIAIKSIDVDLDRSALLDKEVVLDKLAIDGLAVDVVKHADGTTNLTGLFKQSKSKPLGHVKIAKLDVKGAATITKADGSIIAVRDLGITGSVDARPAAKQLELAFEHVGANVEVRGKKLAVALDGITVERSPETVDVDIAKIGAGVVSIEALAAHVMMDKQGQQSITIGKARVDSKQLAVLLGREVVLDDIGIDLSITGPGNALVLHGGVRTRDTKLAFDGTANIAGAVPSYELALVGKGSSGDVVDRKTQVATDLRIDIKGSGATKAELDAEIKVAVGPTTIGKIAVDSLDVKAHAKHDNYTLESLVAKGLGFEVTASGTFVQKVLDAKVGVSGSPEKAVKVLAAAGIAIPRRVPTIGKLDLAVTANGRLDGELAVKLAPTTIRLAGGSIGIAGDATLEKKHLQVAHTTIKLAKLDLEALSRLAGRPPKAAGSLSGNLALTKTATSRDATFDLAIALRDKPLVIAATGTASLSSATAHVEVRRTTDRELLATLGATLPLDAKGFQPNGAWRLSIDVANRRLAEFALLLPERLQKKVPAGAVAVHADLAGSPARPTGTITIAATGQEKIDLTAKLLPTRGGLQVTTDGTISDIAQLHGTLAIPWRFAGKKLDLVGLRAGLTVDATIDIPERPLASLARLRANLAKFDGTIGGTIKVRGAVKTPAIDAALAWKGYQTAANTVGVTTIAATGTPAQLTATIDHGGLKITAAVDRSNQERIAIKAKMRATKSPLLPLIPAFVGEKLEGQSPGSLDWNMDADVVLVKSAAGTLVDRLALTGTLDVTGGTFKVPKSKRSYHDIALSVAGDPNGIRIKSLSAHETDIEKQDRNLAVSGLLSLDKTKPTKLDLSLVAKDWLVFGTEKFGMPDAPRATASFDIGVAVDLTQPIIGVDATIKSLALRSPDRQERGHYAERASISGDIIFVDGKSAGKLPVAAPVVASTRKRRPMDVRIHIPTAIRLQQTPMDVMAKGEIAVTVREDGVKTRGTLTMESGNLNLFGRDHALVEGSLTFDEAHPSGWLAVTFERELPDFAMRELANPKAGARVTLSGSPSKPKTTLSGSANAAMFEVMAMYNAGRPVRVVRPGVPASATVQAPRGDQLFLLTFMASNLPHLLFLDRVTAWSEPERYGQIDNLEAEKYAADQKSRVRAVVRPTTPGRSNAELQYDRLLINNDRAALGVGVRAGDRLGGGLGLFFEWSSR